MVFSRVEKKITACGRFFKPKDKVSKIMRWQEAVNVNSGRRAHQDAAPKVAKSEERAHSGRRVGTRQQTCPP